MQTILIKNGVLIPKNEKGEYERKDVLIRKGRIAKIGKDLPREGTVVDAEGRMVCPGFIDIHTHCYPKAFLGMEPDALGMTRGSTTIIDAGSSGADNFEDFYQNYIKKSKTKVYALLNFSKEGLIRGHELDAPEKISIPALERTLAAYPDAIVGIKARASASVVGDMKLAPIAEAASVAERLHVPLTVHIGHYPPAFTDVLNLLKKGDVATHVFHGKPGGLINEKGEIIPEARTARERGVLFDVGHGEESFSMKVYKKALEEGFDCDTISTDLHIKNVNGPVFSLASVLSKIIALGEPLSEAIDKCTRIPAKVYGLKDLGSIREGYIGDINILNWDEKKSTVADSVGNELSMDRHLVVEKTIYSRGDESEIFA